MAVAWTEDLSVGVPEIDIQHRELFARVDMLLDACNQGKGKQEVGHLLGFLEDYVLTHFAVEERLMIDRVYPAFREHKAEHDYFISQLNQLKFKFRADGAAVNVVLLAVNVSVSWLQNHIRKTDKAVGRFIEDARLAKETA